ncbi:MAG: hypothetical protein GY804_08705 [Alphaproteobacteria bacterium]|nr:hypothetical protein [Alphaproteobacteria bacterium]
MRLSRQISIFDRAEVYFNNNVDPSKPTDLDNVSWRKGPLTFKYSKIKDTKSFQIDLSFDLSNTNIKHIERFFNFLNKLDSLSVDDRHDNLSIWAYTNRNKKYLIIIDIETRNALIYGLKVEIKKYFNMLLNI